jgi:predicted Zn-ribbon and HTH transcriptional regulator
MWQLGYPEEVRTDVRPSRHDVAFYVDCLSCFKVRGPCSTQRQVGELISGPKLATRAWLLSFNRTQSRVVIDLLTGQNTLRRHLYVLGLSNNPACRKCGTEEETSVRILCECEAMSSLRHAHLCSFFLDLEDIRKLIIGAIWNFGKATELL